MYSVKITIKVKICIHLNNKTLIKEKIDGKQRLEQNRQLEDLWLGILEFLRAFNSTRLAHLRLSLL